MSVSTQAADWNSIRKQASHRKRRQSEYLTSDELQRCRKEPTQIREIRGPEWIACALCGVLMQNIAGHLVSDHGEELSPGASAMANRSQLVCLAFRKRFGLQKRFALCSMATSDAMARRAKSSGRIPPGRMTKKVQQAALKAIREYGVSPAERRNKRATALQKQVGNALPTKEPKVPRSQIADLRLQGLTEEKIAKKWGLSRETVFYHLEKMGFPHGSAPVMFHGEPLDRHHLHLLIEDWIAVTCEASGASSALDLKPHTQLTVAEAADVLSVSVEWIWDHTRARARIPHLGTRRGRLRYLGNAQVKYLHSELERVRREKQQSHAIREITKALRVNRHWITHRLRAKNESWPLSKEMAARMLALWKDLEGQWRQLSAGPSGGRPKKLLPSAQNLLPARYRALRGDLQSLAKAFKTGAVQSTLSAVRKWICEEATRRRMRTLLFWPQFFQWIRKNKDWSLSAPAWEPAEVAKAFLSWDFAVSFETVRRLILS